MKYPLTFATFVVVFAYVGTAFAGEGKVTAKADGEDLVASTMLTANGAPYVLLTFHRVHADKKEVVLGYILIQNPKQYVKSEQKVPIQWRLPGQGELAAKNYTYRLDGFHQGMSDKELTALNRNLQLLLGAKEKIEKK